MPDALQQASFVKHLQSDTTGRHLDLVSSYLSFSRYWDGPAKCSVYTHRCECPPARYTGHSQRRLLFMMTCNVLWSCRVHYKHAQGSKRKWNRTTTGWEQECTEESRRPRRHLGTWGPSRKQSKPMQAFWQELPLPPVSAISPVTWECSYGSGSHPRCPA